MGTIRTSTSHKGKVINGVTLGDPAAPAFLTYDHASLPSGLLLDDGTFVPIDTVPDETPQGNANRETIKAQAVTAMQGNAEFLALASPSQAQTLAQVKALTRQSQALIRLALGKYDGTD
jgi:hypothetical protein